MIAFTNTFWTTHFEQHVVIDLTSSVDRKYVNNHVKYSYQFSPDRINNDVNTHFYIAYGQVSLTATSMIMPISETVQFYNGKHNPVNCMTSEE